MTAFTSQPRPRGRLSRLLMWWGHVSIPYQPYIAVALWVSIWSGWWTTKDGADPAYIVLTELAILPLYTSSVLCEWYHDTRLCHRETYVAQLLLNPQAAVDANLNKLRFIHRLRSVYAVAGALPILALLLPVERFPAPLKVALMVVSAVGIATTYYSASALKAHQRLAPWCPFCRGGGGGGGDTAPAPTPDPAGTRTRT